MHILKHIFHNPFSLARHFPRKTLAAIQAAIKEGETRHRGEICFAVESHIPLFDLLMRRTARQRAVKTFHRLGVHSTAEHNGILIYLCLAGKNIEIVADTGLSPHVQPTEWQRIIHAAAEFFARRDFKGGALLAINDCHDLLARHFPAAGAPHNELDDCPVVI